MDSTDTQNVEQPAGARSLHERVRPLSSLQEKLVASLRGKYALNGNNMSTTELAWRNNTSRLAVSSAMRSLEKQKRSSYYRSNGGVDRWCAQMWYLRADLDKRPNENYTDKWRKIRRTMCVYFLPRSGEMI
jgi:hypothetical protein